MRYLRSTTAALLALALTITPPALAQAQDDAQVRKDLATVLALKGKPCGEIVELRRQAENDYLVTCQDGHRYRIYIGADEHVVIEDRG